MAEGAPYRPKFGFDIRIRPPREEPRRTAHLRPCESPGCAESGDYRAPRSRRVSGEFQWLCLEHVRAFNATWNYFEGMSDLEVRQFQKEALTGHRPTWRIGSMSASSAGQRINRDARAAFGAWVDDPILGLFGGFERQRTPPRALTKRQERAFEVFALEPGSGHAEIRAQYKTLVKRFHPDAHGGDRAMEDRLRDVIEAYQVLKAGGFC